MTARRPAASKKRVAPKAVAKKTSSKNRKFLLVRYNEGMIADGWEELIYELELSDYRDVNDLPEIFDITNAPPVRLRHRVSWEEIT